MTGVFPSVLKTAEVVPVFKKGSKLDYGNYCSISLLLNIDTNFKNFCVKDIFLHNNNLIYNLQFNNILNLMPQLI